MASSRIFVKGIPPTITESDFRRHFSSRHSTTDVRIFPSRRIGYVGYRTPEDAAAAVKYFNKTFMKMSKLAVELARPISDAQQKVTSVGSGAPTGKKPDGDRLVHHDKRKRGDSQPAKVDPKLEEYMSISKASQFASSAKPGSNDINHVSLNGVVRDDSQALPTIADEEDDEEYEDFTRIKKAKTVAEDQEYDPQRRNIGTNDDAAVEIDSKAGEDRSVPGQKDAEETVQVDAPTNVDKSVSDSDWLRSRTSRLLGLLDESEEQADDIGTTQRHTRDPDPSQDLAEEGMTHKLDIERHDADVPQGSGRPVSTNDNSGEHTLNSAGSNEEETLLKSGRLFIRNLHFQVKEDDLREYFSKYGLLEEVHIPVDSKTGLSKGTAYVEFVKPDAALEAYRGGDGQTFHGRLLHILPAAAKRTSKIDEFELSKLPLKKQQQIRRRLDASKTSFNWNALYMNANAVMSSISDRLGVDKAELLDPTSSDAAVKQALAETHVINETKTYFTKNGVDLEAFKKSTKGDTAILVKNFSYGTTIDELKRLFEEHGQVLRMLMPPNGVIAIVEFATATQARAAFASLAYRKLKDSVLFLERAPKDLFKTAAPIVNGANTAAAAPSKAAELLAAKEEVQGIDTSTLFVRNLNFSTTSARLAESFKPLDGFLAARVKVKTDPGKPGKQLSMGFGFIEFRSEQQAQAALAAMDGHTLDGHQLVIKPSQRSTDAGEERRRKDKAQKIAAQKSKVVIKNLPFETSKKDIRTLLRQYGQLRTVRMPKKFDNTARGFAFAEFTTPREAANAIEALRNTHLLGRKMVMDFAEEDPVDAEAEIEKISQRVADKTAKVSLQKLIGGGRKKFDAEEGGINDEAD